MTSTLGSVRQGIQTGDAHGSGGGRGRDGRGHHRLKQPGEESPLADVVAVAVPGIANLVAVDLEGTTVALLDGVAVASVTLGTEAVSGEQLPPQPLFHTGYKLGGRVLGVLDPHRGGREAADDVVEVRGEGMRRVAAAQRHGGDAAGGGRRAPRGHGDRDLSNLERGAQRRQRRRGGGGLRGRR